MSTLSVVWNCVRNVPWIGVATICSAAATIASLVVSAAFLLRQRRREGQALRELALKFFQPHAIRECTRHYVEPGCTSADPSRETEPCQAKPADQRFFRFLDRFLGPESRVSHLLILADSGMGKSSCLINYYVRNRKRHTRRQHRIAIVPLGMPDADAHISSIPSKSETAIFLDALDEDARAISDHRSRLRHLVDLCREFRCVVVTCRTQFFPGDEEIPVDTGLVPLGPRGIADSVSRRFARVYLSPFSDSDITSYLRKRFPLWAWRARKPVCQMIRSVPSLAARPMLLAYMPDLVRAGAIIKTPYDVYNTLVRGWITREKPWVDPVRLRIFSEQLAVDLFLKREARGAEMMPRRELTVFARNWGINLDEWQLSSRSLLNRDSSGNYKFAHRSIMEFLFVRQFLQGDQRCSAVKWTDQMQQFLTDAIRARAWDVLKREVCSSVLRVLEMEPRPADEPYVGTGDTAGQLEAIIDTLRAMAIDKPFIFCGSAAGPIVISDCLGRYWYVPPRQMVRADIRYYLNDMREYGGTWGLPTHDELALFVAYPHPLPLEFHLGAVWCYKRAAQRRTTEEFRGDVDDVISIDIAGDHTSEGLGLPQNEAFLFALSRGIPPPEFWLRFLRSDQCPTHKRPLRVRDGVPHCDLCRWPEVEGFRWY